MKGRKSILIVSGGENDGDIAGDILQRVETQSVGKAYVGKYEINIFRFIKESADLGYTWQGAVNCYVVKVAVEKPGEPVGVMSLVFYNKYIHDRILYNNGTLTEYKWSLSSILISFELNNEYRLAMFD